MKSLQQEWQYLQRITPNCGPAFFEPVKDAIRMVFLPALLEATEEGECQRGLMTLSIRRAWASPIQSVPGCFVASEACTSLLVTSLRKRTRLDAYQVGNGHVPIGA
jgi:hypothetical protein